jgi:anti-sigma factor RsiW
MGVQDHRAFEQELAAYLLDALPAEEARRFEVHMATCERCQADAQWLRAAADALPASVEQIEPPPELRERLLETVRREAVETREAAERREAAETPAVGEGRRRVGGRPRFRFTLRPAAALAAASVALAAGLAGYLIRGDGQPESVTVAARSTPVAPGARASVVRTGDTAVLQVERLPVQSRGRVYQIWLRPKGTALLKPSTLFVVRPDGRGAAAVPGGVEEAGELLVTMEPRGGSLRPRGKPVLRATL